jgi:hypothetical protein
MLRVETSSAKNISEDRGALGSGKLLGEETFQESVIFKRGFWALLDP